MKDQIKSTVQWHKDQLEDRDYFEAQDYYRNLMEVFECNEAYYITNPLYEELVEIHNEILEQIREIIDNKN